MPSLPRAWFIECAQHMLVDNGRFKAQGTLNLSIKDFDGSFFNHIFFSVHIVLLQAYISCLKPKVPVENLVQMFISNVIFKEGAGLYKQNLTVSRHPVSAGRARCSVVTKRLMKLMRLNNLYCLQRENFLARISLGACCPKSAI